MPAIMTPPENCAAISAGDISDHSMQDGPTLDSRRIAAFYDDGYYHGTNSGYPPAGYESEHASWRHWVEHLAAVNGAGASWLDLGCAYGYLVAEARDGGFRAFGVDVSPYALARAPIDAPGATGRLTRGLVETLPFADETFDVVSAFDVLEHLVEPEPALREICRVLRPGGALIGATPDPRLFDRHEATHFSERPPSYWLDRLLALGFAVDFRFFQAPYNLEVAATREHAGRLLSAGRLRIDGFGADADLGSVGGSAAAHVALRLRSGWRVVEEPKPPSLRWVAAGEALAYVLVAGRLPVRVGVRLEARAAEAVADLSIAFDDQRLAQVALDGGWRVLTLPTIPLAAGGHHLKLTASASVHVRALDLVVEPVARAEILARLPFDMYQRYDQCRAVVARVAGSDASILDVGGAMAGDGGHLATTGDFFPDVPPPLVVDVRHVDHPDHRPLSGQRLPFPDASFDVVLCQDVLEHLAAPDRITLLDELTRVSRRFVLLAAPFATVGVAEADALLFELIRARHGYAHRFLAEHLAHGHPDLDATVSRWRAAGATAIVLPNGYLPYWTVMQIANLRLAESPTCREYAEAQVCYSGHVFDWREPAYRHLLVVDLTGRDEWCATVRALVGDAERGRTDCRSARDAVALNGVIDLMLSVPGVTPEGWAAQPSVTGKESADAGRGEDPLLLSAERARLRELERLAARVWSHPVYRLYGRVRRAWRRLAQLGARGGV